MNKEQKDVNETNEHYCGSSQNAVHPKIVENNSQIPAGTIKSHLGYAIFTTLCACAPLGIVAIYYATKVSSFVSVREYEKAAEASAKACVWANWALAFGLLCGCLSSIGRIVRPS